MVCNFTLKAKLKDYTEAEFRRLLEDFFEDTETNDLPNDEYDEYISQLAEHFTNIVEHPEGNGLIFHPANGREDSPEGVIKELKLWYKEQGRQCFKDS
ncbi:bacteriocin immunity protein [Vibrio metschnikovii]